jgi:hypothetical protein
VDEISHGERWGDVRISLAGPIIDQRTELETLGWDERVLDGGGGRNARRKARADELSGEA